MTYRTNAGAPNDRQRIEELKESLRRQPNVQGTVDLALLLLEVGEIDEAQKHLRALLLQRLDDTSVTKADVFYHLATVHERQGDPAKARAMLERALAQDPDHVMARSLLSRIE